MCYGCVNSDGNGIFHGSAGAVGRLEWVQWAWQAGFDVAMTSLSKHFMMTKVSFMFLIGGRWGVPPVRHPFGC
ncbi:hypothetical protein J4Q44_G00076380 [Coregonus suidteri]|uniref:Uncharacterized protein n=1 Tax=Coregonus suidteri TaxID=861788 RepID=A0AAN8N9Q5_9TELE